MVDAPGVDCDAAEANLAEAGEHGGAAREAGGVREAPVGEVEGPDGGDAEDIGREGQEFGHGAVDEDEVLGPALGEAAEPVLEHAQACGECHAAAGEAHAADGAAVGADGAGDGVGGAEPVEAAGAGEGAEEVGVVEDERRGGPDAAPAPGERGGARGVLGGEARHDVGEHRVREPADAVLGAAAAVAAGEGAGATGGRVGRGGEAGEDGTHDLLHLDERHCPEAEGTGGEHGRGEERRRVFWGQWQVSARVGIGARVLGLGGGGFGSAARGAAWWPKSNGESQVSSQAHLPVRRKTMETDSSTVANC